jgi:hypothetical protein
VTAWFVLGLLLALSPGNGTPGEAASEAVYRLDWRSYARVSRWDGSEVVTRSGTLAGTGTARLIPIGSDGFRLEFSGPQGAGNGLIGPAGPSAFYFPTAVEVGIPPAPPHLSGGTFQADGDPRYPDGFEVHFVDGFICHAHPTTCENVVGWERAFTGRAWRAPTGS